MSEVKPLAIVTGGSRGIGAEISKNLAKDGYHVLINYTSSEEKARAVLDQIQAAGGSGDLSRFDVSDADQVSEAFKKISKLENPVHVLVNNAGIAIDSLLLRQKPEDLEKVLAIDLKGAIYCAKEASRLMMKAKTGSIINISSVVAEMGSPGQGAYAAAKAGMIGFSRTIARELASRKIRVNTVTPGFIGTEMTDSLPEDVKTQYLQNIPLGYFGTPNDVASLVGYLASEDSRYITGQVIGVNGGMYM